VAGKQRRRGSAKNGVVYKVSPRGQETVIHSFQGGKTDGATARSVLSVDTAGNIYGTTYDGGTSNVGVVFKIDTSGNESVSYNFAGGTSGGNPVWPKISNTLRT
jgi:uncharacterized repeat protein (TIGR03803 family)